MILNFREKFIENSRNLLRRCGYVEIFDRRSGKTSFSHKLRGDQYPRFHVYINKEEPGFLQLNLHLDMKKPIYEGVTAHSGEYEGEVIEREGERIRQVFQSLVMPAAGPAGAGSLERPQGKAGRLEKKSFWQKLFGPKN